MLEPIKINVNMTGKEYIEYRKSRSGNFFGKPLSKKAKRALPYFIASVVGIVILLILIGNLFYTPPKVEPSRWNIMSYRADSMSWNNIAKIIVVNYAPVLVCFISIAWIVHGFGFLIFKG